MAAWKCESLRRAATMNPGMQVDDKNAARVVAPDGTVINITNSLTGLQLFWGLTGCLRGRQHFRCCTPHALAQPADLFCPFCLYGGLAWIAAGKPQLPMSELQLMAMLRAVGLDELACPQVTMPFWHGAIDFMLTSKRVVLQADGDSHSRGIYSDNPAKKLSTNLSFCVAAVGQGVSAVRMHESDLTKETHPAFLLAAIAEASKQTCTVLSPGYRFAYAFEAGQTLTFAELLVRRLGGASVTQGPFGIVVICKN